MTGESVGAILSEIHGLLHEAKSNVELDPAKGQTLIDRLSATEASQISGALTAAELDLVIREVKDAIASPIEKELSIDNPEAAVIQIQSLLDRLKQTT